MGRTRLDRAARSLAIHTMVERFRTLGLAEEDAVRLVARDNALAIEEVERAIDERGAIFDGAS